MHNDAVKSGHASTRTLYSNKVVKLWKQWMKLIGRSMLGHIQLSIDLLCIVRTPTIEASDCSGARMIDVQSKADCQNICQYTFRLNPLIFVQVELLA